jgi:hypothetical protein
VVRRVLEASASGQEAASRKIGDDYSSCIDETTITLFD